MKATHLLLWSGGFDSTAILLRMITNPEQFPKVRVIGCGLRNTFNYEEDKNARKKIAEILGIDKYHEHITYREVDQFDVQPMGGLGQAPTWAFVTSCQVTHEDDGIELYYGYIRGDDFWHFRPTFELAVRNLIGISINNMNLKFNYPLEWNYKKEFVSWYLHRPQVFNALSWGGDTVAAKLKEREELEFLYRELTSIKNHVPEKAEVKQLKEPETIKSEPINKPVDEGNCL